MSYPYKPHQIEEILQQDKCLPSGDTLELEKMSKGNIGRRFESRPQLVDGPFVPMRYVGKAPELDNPETYDASFLLASQRVRGVGYDPIGRQNFRFKKRIPKGWHLNVCDPNLPTNDPQQNIHQPLPDFSTTDFRDFIQQTAKMWKIDLGWAWEGELFS
jgi:hypothetical protein